MSPAGVRGQHRQELELLGSKVHELAARRISWAIRSTEASSVIGSTVSCR
jgi:hypothetical protein